MPLRRDGPRPGAGAGRGRETEPVHKLAHLFGLNVWVVSGHAEAKSVLADTANFSNDIRPLVGSDPNEPSEGIGGLGFTDPPDHTRLRKLLTPEFTKRRLARLEPAIEKIVNDQLDLMEAKGPVADIVSDFAFNVPFLLIADLLGVEESDRDRFRALGPARFDLSGGGIGVFGSASESRDFLFEIVRKQRAEPRRRADRVDHPRARRRDRRHRARRARGRGVPRRLRDVGEHARARHAGAAARPGELRADPERAGRGRRDRRGAAAVPDRGPGRVPAVRAARPGAVRPAGEEGRPRRGVAVRRRPGQAGLRRRRRGLLPRRTVPPRTSRSATACTAASAPNWRGWSSAPPSPPWPTASRTCRLAVPEEQLRFRDFSIVYGVETLPVQLHASRRPTSRRLTRIRRSGPKRSAKAERSSRVAADDQAGDALCLVRRDRLRGQVGGGPAGVLEVVAAGRRWARSHWAVRSAGGSAPPGK